MIPHSTKSSTKGTSYWKNNYVFCKNSINSASLLAKETESPIKSDQTSTKSKQKSASLEHKKGNISVSGSLIGESSSRIKFNDVNWKQIIDNSNYFLVHPVFSLIFFFEMFH